MIPAAFSTDPFMGARYTPNTYVCRHFARDVWLELTGEDIGDRIERPTDLRLFERLDGPSEPSLVLFRAPRQQPHIGVYLRKRVLHLSSRYGALFQPLPVAALGFRKVSFYR